MSQFSDSFTPSLYGSDSIDTFTNIPQDNLTPDLSHSQQSFNSDNDYSTFRTPAPPPPSSLQRVGPDRKKSYVLYTTMSKTEFVEWWLRTEYGAKKRIRWDSNRRSSSMWDSFDQVAHASDGKAKLMCKKCGGILDHPHNNEHGTSTMARHLKGSQCRNLSANRTKQKGIMSLVQDTVNYPNLYYTLTNVDSRNILQRHQFSLSRHGRRSFLPLLQGQSFLFNLLNTLSFKN